MKESFNISPVQTERRRNAQESFNHLNSLLREVANDISRELKEKFGAEKLISSDCSIRMEPFKALDAEQVSKDREFIKEREKEWSGIKTTEEDGEQLNPEEKKRIDVLNDKLVREWLERKKKEKSKQLEMVVTILLHKAFGDKYVVVRSSRYDDYAGGVDNVIVNKQTGAIICAVDDLRENERSDRRAEKDKEVLKKTRAGGAELAYGFTFKDGKIERKTMKNLPVFCLGLDETEYDEIINAIEYKSGESNGINFTERKILDKILASIREQRDALLTDPEVQRQSGIVESLRRVQELVG